MENNFISTGVPFSYVLVRTDRCYVVIKALDIIALRVFDKYVNVHIVGIAKPLMVPGSLGSMEEKLFPFYFCRTHGCCVVGLSHIVSIQDDSVLLRGAIEVPLSRQYRKGLLNRFPLLS